jgi:tetratricopeptide (TPR) repeat protein
MNRNLKKVLSILFAILAVNIVHAQNAEAYFKEGEAKSKQSNYIAAIDAYSKAIEADPKMWNAFVKRAFCYGLTDQYAKAVEDYTVAIAAEPDKIYSYQSRGSAHYKLGHYPEALADFDKVIALDPKNQEAFNNRGFVKKNLGDKEGACKDWYTSKKMGNDEAKIIIKNNSCK